MTAETKAQDAAAVAGTNVQVTVSSLLTVLGLSFATELDEHGRRFWFMQLTEAPGAPDVQIAFSVDGNIFAVEAAFSYEDLDVRDLYWSLQDRVPLVRIEPEPVNHDPPLAWVCTALPIDGSPPYVMPGTIQLALNSVFTAMVTLLREHPGKVRSEQATPSRHRSWRKPLLERKLAPDGGAGSAPGANG